MADAEPVSGGKALRRLRRAAGLTQEELAERAGLSARAIRALETGARRAPRRDTVDLLATALGLDARERERFMTEMRRQPPPTPAFRPGAAPATFTARGRSKPLVGRQRERALIERSLASEGPPLLLLSGEPGIGKSRLLEAAAERAERLGWTVLTGACHRRSAQQPYAPCVEALTRFLATRSPAQWRRDTQGCAWLVRLLPEMAQMTSVPSLSWALPPEQERRLMFSAVARLLSNVAGSAGTLLVLDDLQWASIDAIDLLGFLVREVGGRSLRVMGAYRDTDVTSQDALPTLVADLARDELGLRAQLDPLARDDAALLLGELLADASAELNELRDSMLSRAEGVPFYLVSCAQEARVAGEGAQATAFVVPWSAAESIRQRVASLPAAARDLLTIAAVNERQTPRDALFLVADGLGYSENVTLEALEQAIHARLLYEDSGRYVFTHDLIRETLEQGLSGARRAALHRRIGEALERLPHPERRAATLAGHFAQCDDFARALPYALLAGEQAEAVYAHAEAAQHYRSAITYASAIDLRSREAEATEKLADVLYHLGRYEESCVCFERAIAMYRADGDWERLAWATAQLARSGDPLGKTAESLARLADLFTSLSTAADGRGVAAPDEPLTSQAERAVSLLSAQTTARVYLCLTSRLLFLRRFAEVYAPADLAIRFARAAGDLRIESLACAFRAEAQIAQGKVAEAVVSATDARERAQACGDLEALYRAHIGIFACQWAQGDLDSARATLAQNEAVIRGLGAARYIAESLSESLCGQVACSLALGEWDTAREQLAQIADAESPHAPDEFDTSASIAVAVALVGCADILPEMRARLDEEFTNPLWLSTTLALGERDLLAGRAETADARLRRALARLEDSPDGRCALLALLAWAEGDLGAHEQAAATLSQSRSLAVALRNIPAQADGERMLALLAARDGRWDDAQQAIQRALALCQQSPYPYVEAKARWLSGQICVAIDDVAQAQREYQRALDICARLGEWLYRPHIEQALAL